MQVLTNKMFLFLLCMYISMFSYIGEYWNSYSRGEVLWADPPSEWNDIKITPTRLFLTVKYSV